MGLAFFLKAVIFAIMKHSAPFLGSHVKLNSTGEIVEVVSSDDSKVTLKSFKGLETLDRAAVSRLTDDEDLQRLKSEDERLRRKTPNL